MTGPTDALLDSLSDARARLPNRTLFALALAGLRVRMVRSLVTLGSVVLAIAYLSYIGLNNALIYRLAHAQEEHRDEVVDRLRAAGISVETIRAGAEGTSRSAVVRALRACAGNALDRWLATMALLTCAVGIANAMLMSVTERFREIGTMKCLGAENRTIVKLFVIESSLMGLAGSCVGIGIGYALAILVAWAQFGRYAWLYLPGASMVLYGGLSLAAGVALCLIAAGYPSLLAARMRPVDALRVEE